MKMAMPLWSTSAYISKWDELQPSDQTDMEEAHLAMDPGQPT
jgi:hypothetical protein